MRAARPHTPGKDLTFQGQASLSHYYLGLLMLDASGVAGA